MSFSVEEDNFCNVYCNMVNGEWEDSMKRAISESEAELNVARDNLDSLLQKRSWIVKKMRDPSVSRDRYALLQRNLEKMTKAQERFSAAYYREKRRHAELVKGYRMESRKRLGSARAAFRGMTMNQRVLLARQLMDRGIAMTACEMYLVAAGEHAASYGVAMDQVQETADLALHRPTEKDIAVKEWKEVKQKKYIQRREHKNRSFQRTGYAEGRKIDVN